MLDRLKLIFSNEKIDSLKNTKILLVGLGGVGGMTFEMLIRSGISNITICDYDTFEISNLNRQILSSVENIGDLKVDVAKKRALDINNEVNIKCISKKIDELFLEKFTDKFDYIIDACDDIKAKICLIKYALNNNIKIISCCGTGNKINPEKLEITNIYKTKYDPLAKKLRYELRKEKIYNNIPVVSSSEVPIKNDKVGSLCTVTNYAGILLASYVINDILK